MEALVSIALGVGLAAACGLRVFVPFLVLGAAQRLGMVEVGKGFAWLGSDAGLLVLLVESIDAHLPLVAARRGPESRLQADVPRRPAIRGWLLLRPLNSWPTPLTLSSREIAAGLRRDRVPVF